MIEQPILNSKELLIEQISSIRNLLKDSKWKTDIRALQLLNNKIGVLLLACFNNKISLEDIGTNKKEIEGTIALTLTADSKEQIQRTDYLYNLLDTLLAKK